MLPGRTVLLLFTFLILSATGLAHAGFFDQLVNDAKKTIEDSIQNTTSGTPDNHSGVATGDHSVAESQAGQSNSATSVNTVQAVYDKSQVREIQQGLNSIGYNAGTPDGLYGSGTRQAIESFQLDTGLVADGKPSSTLLAQIKDRQMDSPAAAASGGSAYRPDSPQELGRAAYRATLHYHPEVLDDEKWLKDSAYRLFPEESVSFTGNEFAWQKNKAAMKQKILNQIDNPPLTLTASWLNQSGGYLVVGNYDFDKKGFKILSAKISPPGVGDNRPYTGKLLKAIRSKGWLPVPQDKAEKIATTGNRRLYGEFDFTITGAKKYLLKGEIKLLSEFSIEKIGFYSLQNQKYDYVGTLDIPDIAEKKTETAPAPQSQKTGSAGKIVQQPQPVEKTAPVKEKVEEKPAAVAESVPADPYSRANSGQAFGPDVVNIRLGMTLEQAENEISQRKEIMKIINGRPPRPFASARMFVLKPGDEFIGLMTLNTPHGERIASINRTVYFDPENSPSQTAVVSSIEKKYGTPSYKYDSAGQFNRTWLTDSNNKLFTSTGSELRGCEDTFSGSGRDVWLDNGQYYQWTMPWRERQFMGVRNGQSVANLKESEDKNVFGCGPANKVSYSENGGMLTGPSLNIQVYDPAWVIAEYRKSERKEVSEGVKDLDL